MKKAFVTGFPIKQSKSPLLHGFWLSEHHIEGSYEAIEIAPKDFESFLKNLPSSEYSGGNVTIPHKEIACKLVEKLEPAAEVIGAVNTLWLEEGKICGGNTDGYGFAANLDEYARNWREGKTAIILGAGGASRAVIHAVLEAGYSQVHIVNRTVSRAENLSDRFGRKCMAHGWNALSEIIKEADFIVNTTSLGMIGNQTDNQTAMPDFTKTKNTAIVTDIVYAPLETPMLKLASNAGLKTVDGLGMLLHQAVPGFEKWFAIRPNVTRKLRDYILGIKT